MDLSLRRMLKNAFRRVFRSAFISLERKFQAERIFVSGRVPGETVMVCAVCKNEELFEDDDSGWADMRAFSRDTFICPDCLDSQEGQEFIRVILGCPKMTVGDMPS